jgi:hypothetical protein
MRGTGALSRGALLSVPKQRLRSRRFACPCRAYPGAMLRAVSVRPRYKVVQGVGTPEPAAVVPRFAGLV